MDLDELYYQIKEKIEEIDFNKLWPGFTPLKFALYNERDCFFDGEYIKRPMEFVANTSLLYNKEYIAIWRIDIDNDSEYELNYLISKIIHEMFHGYQMLNHWPSFPNEMEAIFRYQYDLENLTIKHQENKLLLELYKKFDFKKYQKLLQLKKYRQHKFSYQFNYESLVEEIEGSATYVEYKVLELLDAKKWNFEINGIEHLLKNEETYFPIRVSLYNSGALMITVSLKVDDAPLNFHPFILDKLEHLKLEDVSIVNKLMEKRLLSYQKETLTIINEALRYDQQIKSTDAKLIGVNIYSARHYDEFVTSLGFLMYQENGQIKALDGNYVIWMKDDKNINKIYLMK